MRSHLPFCQWATAGRAKVRNSVPPSASSPFCPRLRVSVHLYLSSPSPPFLLPAPRHDDGGRERGRQLSIRPSWIGVSLPPSFPSPSIRVLAVLAAPLSFLICTARRRLCSGGGGWGIDWSSSQLNHHPSMPRPPQPAASDGDGDGESGDGVHGGRPSYAVSETRSQHSQRRARLVQPPPCPK